MHNESCILKAFVPHARSANIEILIHTYIPRIEHQVLLVTLCLPKEISVGIHVGEESADEGSQVDHVGRLVLDEDGLSLRFTKVIGS